MTTDMRSDDMMMLVSAQKFIKRLRTRRAPRRQMNDLPDELIAKILAASDHASRAAAMFVSKSMFRVAEGFDDLWTDAEFKRYDETLPGFFRRHRVRNLTLTCSPPEAVKILNACRPGDVETLSARFRFADEIPPALSPAISRAGSNLKRLELRIDEAGSDSTFVVPWLPSLTDISIVEKSRVRCIDVSFYKWEYPNLERVEICAKSCGFASRAARCSRLRDARLRLTYPDHRVANFGGLSMDRLEIDADESFDACARELVLFVEGYGSFRHPFDADNLTFAFASNDCCLDLHDDVIRAAKRVTIAPGIRYTPFVAWHVNVENSSLEAARDKIRVADSRVTLNFINVQFKCEP